MAATDSASKQTTRQEAELNADQHEELRCFAGETECNQEQKGGEKTAGGKLVGGKEKKRQKSHSNPKTGVQMKKKKRKLQNQYFNFRRHVKFRATRSDHINSPALLLQFALPRGSRPSMSPRVPAAASHSAFLTFALNAP